MRVATKIDGHKINRARPVCRELFEAERGDVVQRADIAGNSVAAEIKGELQIVPLVRFQWVDGFDGVAGTNGKGGGGDEDFNRR